MNKMKRGETGQRKAGDCQTSNKEEKRDKVRPCSKEEGKEK